MKDKETSDKPSSKNSKDKKKKQPVKVLTIQARYPFTDSELVGLSREQQTAMREIDALECQLKSIKSDFKAKIETIQLRVNLLGSKVTDGFEMRECQAVVEYNAKTGKKKFYRHDTDAKDGQGEFIREEQMTATDFQPPLLDESAPMNPVLDVPTADAIRADLAETAAQVSDEEADAALKALTGEGSK